MPIAWVQNVGTAQSKTTGTTLGYTLSVVQAITAGNRVVVCFAMDPAAGTVGCTDTAGNTYVLVGDRTQGSATSGVRTVLFSASIATAMSGALASITVSHPSAAARALTIAEFSGVSSANDVMAVDGAVSASSATGSPSLTKSDHRPRSRLFVVATGKEAPTNTITQPTGWVAIPAIATSGGSANTNIQASGAYRIVDDVPSVSYAATHSTTAAWACVLHAIRAAPTVGVEVLVQSVRNSDGSETRLYATMINAAGRFSLRTDNPSGQPVSLVLSDGTTTPVNATVPAGEKSDWTTGTLIFEALATIQLQGR